MMRPVCCGVSGVLAVALMIIGAMGAAGALSGTAIGAWAIGLAVPLTAAGLRVSQQSEGKHRVREIIHDLVYGLAMAVMGALAFAGVLPAGTIGWCLLVPTLGYATLKSFQTYCPSHYENI